jgi:hypothetical protein
MVLRTPPTEEDRAVGVGLVQLVDAVKPIERGRIVAGSGAFELDTLGLPTHFAGTGWGVGLW